MTFVRGTTDITSSNLDLEEVDIYGNGSANEEQEANANANEPKTTFWEKRSIAIADRPWTYCCSSLLLTLILGVGGLVAGGFTVTVDGAGWESRGTLIADRHMQFMIIDYNSDALYNDKSGEIWTDLIENKQENYFDDDDDDSRRLIEKIDVNVSPRPFFDSGDIAFPSIQHNRKLPFELNESLSRRLQLANDTGLLQGCDITWYSSDAMMGAARLWPVWQLKEKESGSFLDENVLEELCEQESLTQQYLVENKLCFGCTTDDRCLQPFSPVLYARLIVENGMTLNCEELASAWGTYKDSIADELVQCVIDLKADYNPERDGQNFPASCPAGFSPAMLDELYDTTERVQYTSSVFATTGEISELYAAADNFARGKEHIQGAYDTQNEDFVNLSLDDQLLVDMSLALASAFITTAAMVVHTRSLFLALTGLLQIILSFPLAYTVYKFLGQLDFFPFLNFIGGTYPNSLVSRISSNSLIFSWVTVFVIFALGADDVFVSVDKWKNARLRKPDATVQEIAAEAFPDAAAAMFLTTATTAMAFFGTAVCPVAPIKCFAIFVALMIILDYVLCVLLVFPALIIYDNRRSGGNGFFATRCTCFGWCKKDGSDESGKEESYAKESGNTAEAHEIDADFSLIRRILSKYYDILHKCRWPLLVICGAAFILTALKAASLDLPTSSDVRLYNENDNQFEQNFVWRQHLLYDTLQKKGGSTAFVIWGVKPDDNGDMNNPDKWSSLVLDNTFEPSKTEAQVFLRDFCDKFFANDFAGLVISNYRCPINRFDDWLQEQAASNAPDRAYSNNCGGASSLPMDPTAFDACMSTWAGQQGETTVLSRQGKVEAMYIKFNSRVRYDSPFKDMDDEWHIIEDYMDSLEAPPSASNAYFTSEDYWWFDTMGQMLKTAYASSGIAMAAAAAAILLSSRSIVLTLFSTLSVGYVLTSVMATLVAMGWTLGFLEAILFAILIGISCDFVIHFSHAYARVSGDCDCAVRTKYALLSMGPSILAAAVTTFLAATLMLFTVIIFFQKFAVVLFMTVLQATIGSFVVFLTMTDAVGPSHPTYLYDKMITKFSAWRRGSSDT
eukprot:scaffold2907_cov161-Amphora_coffeaeformis.AAC.6